VSRQAPRRQKPYQSIHQTRQNDINWWFIARECYMCMHVYYSCVHVQLIFTIFVSDKWPMITHRCSNWYRFWEVTIHEPNGKNEMKSWETKCTLVANAAQKTIKIDNGLGNESAVCLSQTDTWFIIKLYVIWDRTFYPIWIERCSFRCVLSVRLERACYCHFVSHPLAYRE